MIKLKFEALQISEEFEDRFRYHNEVVNNIATRLDELCQQYDSTKPASSYLTMVMLRMNPLGYSFAHTTDNGITNIHSLTERQLDETLTDFLRGHEEGEVLVNYFNKPNLLIELLSDKGYTLSSPFEQLDKEEKADVGGVIALLNKGILPIDIRDYFKDIEAPYTSRVLSIIEKVVPSNID